MSIFKNQTYLRIQLTTGVNITSALETKIYYEKPDGEKGNVDATVSDATMGIIYYDLIVDNSILDQIGSWRFWAYIKFSDGRIARGDSVSVRILDDTV